MKKMLCLLLCILMVASLFAGCQGNTNNPQNGERPTLKLFIINGNYHEGATKDSVWKYIEDQVGVNIEISGMVNSDDYYTTLSPRLNTATNMPDIFFAIPNSTGGAYYTWSDQTRGILHDWMNLMAGQEDQYPWLYKVMTSDQYKNLVYNGAHTLLPNISTPNSDWGIYYRADWLIKIGYYTEDAQGNKVARPPVNMDEFQDVMMKFSDPSYDLNGDGSKTYGMSPFAGEWANQPLYHAFGAPTDYDLDENGNVEFMCLTDEYRNFLEWFNMCYESGWIDPQFYTNTPGAGGDSKAFEEGKTGILITNAGAHVQWNAKPMEEIWGKGTCVMGPPPVGTKNIGKEGAGGWSNWGAIWGGFNISLTCQNTDAALRLMNYLYSPEGCLTKSYGIEGTHWKWNEDKTEIIPLVEARAAEPEGTFANVANEDGVMGPYGAYRFDGILGANIDWDMYNENGALSHITNWNMVMPEYAHLMEQAAQYNGMLCTSQLVNFTDMPAAISRKFQTISDLCDTFAIQAIVGRKNLTTDWEALKAECNKEGLDKILAAYEEALGNQ